MWHKIIIAALIVVMLFMASCVYLSNPSSVDRPAIISDNSGGAIAIYEVHKSHDERGFHVQRIGLKGDFLWGEKGILIDSGYKNWGSLFDLHAVSDGLGGTIVVWTAYPSRPNWKLAPGQRRVPYVTHVAKSDSEGNIQWQREILGAGEAMADGSGGVIITSYSYPEERPHIIMIDSKGNFPWGEDGVSSSLHGTSATCDTASDNLGGAIVVQETDEHSIFAQRIDCEGNMLWGQGGLLVSTPRGESPQVAGDGSGGAMIVWMHGYRVPDIYAQKVDSEGNILWQANGIPVCIGPPTAAPHIVNDSLGGAIIAWRAPCSIYSQRIDYGGNVLWSKDGVQVWEAEGPQSPNYCMVADGSGGAIVVWKYVEEGKTVDQGGILRAQKLDATGRKLWEPNGTLVSTGSWGYCSPPTISQDGHGGVIIAWTAGKGVHSANLSYVQRIDAQGNCLWGEKGILLNR